MIVVSGGCGQEAKVSREPKVARRSWLSNVRNDTKRTGARVNWHVLPVG